MADWGAERPHAEGGLPFGVWCAIGEAVAVLLMVPALRLLGLI